MAKKDKGKGIVGCTYVYQNGTYTYAGNRRKMMYWDLKPYFKAYDTMRIIKSENISKNELYEKKLEVQQDDIFNKILDTLEARQQTTITTMQVKQLIEKDLGIVWDLKRVEDNLKLMASPLVCNKSVFDFSVYA